MARAGFTVLFLFGIAAYAHAQWNADSTENTPVCTASMLQNNVRIVTDAHGGAVIVWQDQRNAASTQTDVYAQRMDSAGYPQWTLDGVAMTNDVGAQQQLGIAPDSAGGAVAVWRDQYRGIVAQRILGDGTVHWSNGGTVLSPYKNYLGFPQVIKNTTGGFIAAWADDRGSNTNIFVQALDDTGGIRWASNGVQLKPIGIMQSLPVMIPRKSGGAIVIWMESGLGLVAQAVADDGSLPWGSAGRVVCSISGGSEYPKMVSDGNDGAIIAWTDRRSGSTSAEIYAQHISASGNATWTSEGNIVCGAEGDQSDVTIESDGAGGAIIAWDDRRSGAPGIYAHRINPSGTLLWQTNGIPICTLPTSSPLNPQIASDGNGGVFVTWEDSRNSSRIDVYMQRLNEFGAKYWLSDGLPLSVTIRSQSDPRLIADGYGNAIITWEDARDNGIHNDVYAAKTSAEGRIPVEYALFEASVEEGNVLLHWITESETNSFSFVIERSFDGASWHRIGDMAAAGNSSTRLPYYFTDAGPFAAGTVSYRLKQIDTDGTYAYSPAVTVAIGQAGAFAIHSLYPQPAVSTSTMRVAVPELSPLRVSIYNTLGILVRSVPGAGPYQPGVHDIALPLNGLPDGIYTVAVSGTSGIRTVPLIVQR